MAVAVPQKIILRSATGITLNDRFTNIATRKPLLDVKPERVQMVADRYEANLIERLALIDRAHVKSELDTDHWRSNPAYMSNRLGSTPIHQRLSIPFYENYVGRGHRPWRSILEDRLRGVSNGYVDTRSYGSTWYSGGWGSNPYKYDRYPPPSHWFDEDNFDDQSPYRGVYTYRGGVRRGSTQGAWQATGRGRGRGRGHYNYRGHRGGYRGQRWRRGQYSRGRRGGRVERYRPVTKEELDNEIDEYMAKTRTEVNLFVG